jgi:hypothetical protein
MPKKKLKTTNRKSKLVEELQDAPPEIVTDEQSLVSTEQQRPYMPGGITGKGFRPGQSGNPNGRPKDLLRSIGLNIANKKARKILSEEELDLIRRLDMNPNDITVIEAIMTLLATSTNKDKLELFMDRTFGKVPNININAEVTAAVVARFKNKFTDAELERIGEGEDALEILLEKIPDVPDIHNDEEIVDALD